MINNALSAQSSFYSDPKYPREPFPSKITGTNMTFGTISKSHPLTITSHMAENGVIFSDGVEADYIQFNAGSTARIGIANRKAHLIVN